MSGTLDTGDFAKHSPDQLRTIIAQGQDEMIARLTEGESVR